VLSALPGVAAPGRLLAESFMSNRLRFFSSSVGTKILIAVTGLSLFGFLIVHLAGNLLLLVGPASFNHYSDKLISNPLIYIAEAGLAALFVLHVFKTLTNWAANRSARPVGYQMKQWAGYTSRKTVGSTTMIYTGVVTFVFVLLHLKTFKFGSWYQAAGEPEVRDLYRLTMEVFSNPAYVGFYVICMVLIFLHLRHGLSSALQSLGVNHPRYNRLVLTIGTVLAVLIGGGFALIPIWAFLVGGRS
jgi:succinate dehydrogenase / fumarate reductase cytochrome b subunit